MQVLDDVQELSDKLKIKPLSDNEVAVFRLKNAGVKDGSRDVPSCPEWVQLSGVQQVVDPYHKGPDGQIKPKQKLIGTYIKDYRQMGQTAKPVYQDLIFIKGELRLTSDRFAEYQFAMRNKDCGTNKYRKQMGATKAPKFDLVGMKEITPFMQMADMKYHAEKMIRESTFQYLREVAAKLNMSPDKKFHVKSFNEGFAVNPEQMKYELIMLAQQFPKQVMGCHPDQKTVLRVQIYDAQVYGVLALDNKQYVLDTNNEFVELIKAEEDVDKVDSLIDYFMSEKGKDHYRLFAKTLGKALNVGKTPA